MIQFDASVAINGCDIGRIFNPQMHELPSNHGGDVLHIEVSSDWNPTNNGFADAKAACKEGRK